MNYRTRNYPEAARLMDEQIVRYPGGLEVPAALYWRGRIYEDEERNFPQAVNYYRRLSDVYADYYYANLARQRLDVLGLSPPSRPHPRSTPPTSLPRPSSPAISPRTTPTSLRPASSPTPRSTSTSHPRSPPVPPPASGARSPRPKSSSPTASSPAPSSP